jgi:hypothetical protein
MKNSLLLLISVVGLGHGLSSCCTVPAVFCNPCADSSYRPLGRPATPGEAYTAGYICGHRDQREGRGQCWDRHVGEVAVGLQEFGAKGYADGYAGKVQTECHIPDQRRATRLYR